MKNSPAKLLPRLGAGLRRRRGSVLILVLFMLLSLCLILTPLMQETLTEARMNSHAVSQMQARDAAESAIEYGVALLKMRWTNEVSFPPNALITNPLVLPSNISTWLWNGTNVNPTNVTLTGGVVPTSQWIYIDPANPANAEDPERGRLVLARNVNVYASATATSSWGGNQTAYAEESLQVRDGPLFSDAVFYNMDLEFYPGPTMNITGPVHSNGNIWALVGNGNSLVFNSTITTSGNFNIGTIPWPTNWGASGSGETAHTGNTVMIPSGNGTTWLSPSIGSGCYELSSSYWDSRATNFTSNGTSYSNWGDFAANRWNGYLQTGSMGVNTQTIVGYDSYVSWNGTGGGTVLNDDENYAYAMIEPNQFNGTSNAWNLGAGENQKFEREASLILRVYPGPAAGGNTGVALALANNLTATVYSNHVMILAYEGANTTAGNTTATLALDFAVGNIAAAANSISSNTAVLGNLTSYLTGNEIIASTVAGNYAAVVSATIPAADPTHNPEANITVQKPFMLINQVANTNSVGTGLANFTGNESTLDMQWQTAGGNTTRFYRTVGYTWASISTLNTTVASNGLRSQNFNSNTSITDSYGDVVYAGDVIENPVAVNASMFIGTYNTSNGNYTPGSLNNMLAFSPSIGDLAGTSSFSMNATTGCLTTFGSSSTLWGGMYDGRRAENIQTVTMDMGKLRYVLDNNVGTANFTSNTTMFWGNSTSSYNPTSQYNGIMYVEFPMNSPNITRLSNVTVGNNTYTGDQVLTSQDGWGLVIANGTSNATTYASSTPQYGVPNPTYNNSTLSSNATGRNPGFSLATNNALYVLGAFNADGKSTTPVSPNNPATTSDNLTYADPPACLAADSVTILSPNWKCITSGTDTTSSGGADTAAFDEVCAGFLTGIVPALTYSNITESGGAHNFPRFLENWSGVNFVYRGSIVALFKSEVASQPWGNSTYYSAPNRVWGFYSQFANGFFPPGTPNARYYMRVNFQYLTAAQYNAAIAGLP